VLLDEVRVKYVLKVGVRCIDASQVPRHQRNVNST
jgi:hypothetical protein